ncbi:MAG: hypothetical protein HY242_01090 [Afipia sp.]|nr:hypothetical protein [Afipia sp.]
MSEINSWIIGYFRDYGTMTICGLLFAGVIYLEKIRNDVSVIRAIMWKRHFNEG